MNAIKHISIGIIILAILVCIFPKKYRTYPGLIPPSMQASWEPEKCFGVSIKIPEIYRVPDGEDKVCFGIVYK